MHFAQAAATPEPQAFLQFWVIAAFLLGIAVNIVTVIKLARTQKREVSFTFIPASKDEFDKHVQANVREHENIFSRLNGMDRGCAQRMDELSKSVHSRIDTRLDTMMREDREARAKVHERINQVLTAVSELKGKVER